MGHFHFHKKHVILPMKIMATICLGRYSGLVSYSLSQEKHPSSQEPGDKKVLVPVTAIIGGACCMATLFLAKSKHRYRYALWFIVGTVPICMGLSGPACEYILRGSSPSDWYKFKTLRSLVAFAVFSFCTVSLAIEDH